MCRNVSKIKDYLQEFHQKLMIVAISETCLSDDKELDVLEHGWAMIQPAGAQWVLDLDEGEGQVKYFAGPHVAPKP